MAASLCGAATILVVQDVLRSVEHYRDLLGFRTDFTYGAPTLFAGVERDGVVIHLEAASQTKRQPGHGALNIFVTDVDAFYQELRTRGARPLSEPRDYPWGMRHFSIYDLDSNYLCFGMESRQQVANLRTVELKAFIPAKDYELSKRFYQDVGFTLASDTEGVAYFHHENVSFLLQRFYAKELAENLMLHLLVEDVDAWWAKIKDAGIAERYGVKVSPIQLQPWRMRDFVLFDPSGVLWRIAHNTD
jgi:uncharacterized glyoxalase superfamily protein PhnB